MWVPVVYGGLSLFDFAFVQRCSLFWEVPLRVPPNPQRQWWDQLQVGRSS